MRVTRRAAARFVSIVLACSLLPRPSVAQSTSRQPPSPNIAAALTLDEAVREALEHNLTLVAERYSLAVADARILTAQLRPNP